MLSRHLHVGATLLVFLCGCGAAVRPDHPTARSAAVLRVENHHWEDVTVFMVRNESPLRLGVVNAGSTQRFRVPESYVGSGLQVRLMAQAFASRITHVSQEMTVAIGGSIDWTVEGRLTQSSIQVRPPF